MRVITAKQAWQALAEIYGWSDAGEKLEHYLAEARKAERDALAEQLKKRDIAYVDYVRVLSERDELLAQYRDALGQISHLDAKIDALAADAKRWRAIKPLFRAMSLDIGGNHTWTLAHFGLIKGPSMDCAVDQLMKDSV